MGQDDRTTEEKRSAAARLVTRMLHGYFAISRGMTLGVRAACYDDAGRIFLVRHSYVPGWHMPGGGSSGGKRRCSAFEGTGEEGHLALAGPAHLITRIHTRSAAATTCCSTGERGARRRRRKPEQEMSKAASSLSTEPPARRDAGAASAAWGTQRGGPARHLWSARFGERLAAVRPSRSSSVRRHPQGRLIDLLLR